ncbi:MAG: hypothetical protein M5U32_07415 [Myxococcota bacterium]|nr:hypothetical protein [Myxococcota bacterium]
MGDPMQAFAMRKLGEVEFVDEPDPEPGPLVGNQTARSSAVVA